MNRRAALLLLGVSSILVTAGCAPSTQGDPGAEVAPDITFHPCDAIPAEAIHSLGLDVRPPDRRDHDNPKSLGCGYLSNAPEYGLTIASRPDTLDKVKSDDRFDVLSETEIGGRRALVSDFRGGSACTVSVAIEPGILEFMIGYSELEDFTTVDAACDQATKVATALAPYFPDHL
ncbi:DUF3558 domain-containing protein [Rhodococcus sp. IEGM 1305]|uniref:DUF3558 domain-containing protein n=1 Tax=Rhodococcus sp. IEGM 1305 TaxID=3047092 RepID=UPI0024B7AEA6|nr:DUF3558 domain-containing protein [Rhodococcus sp. IEGM 1305]MDI9953732.1 DUF3558 domain-containing protein [Rhodococcus sp. IEGM 1305]